MEGESRANVQMRLCSAGAGQLQDGSKSKLQRQVGRETKRLTYPHAHTGKATA